MIKTHVVMRTTQRLSVLLLISTVVLTACGASSSNNNGNASSGPTKTPAPPSDAITISMLYGSEKQAWVEDVTKTFNSGGYKTTGANPKPIYVTTEAVGSGESKDDIINGLRQPTIWSPASGLWLPLANDDWLQKGNTATLVDPASCPNVVISPVVVAMWKRQAQALGWPKIAITWSDIAALATDPLGWADPKYNLPGFGKFRFGHTHPDYSNSGFETILALAYAATKPDRVLTIADVKKPETAKFVNEIESAVAHYGSSTGFLGNAMIARGPSYLSASVLYESSVVSSYKADGTSKNGSDSLVAIYPSDGTFLSDHPTCILSAPWVTADQAAAAKVYRDFLLAVPQQQKALTYGFRPGISDKSIQLDSVINAQNGADATKPQSALQVPDAATIRAVRDLWQQQKRQVNLLMVMDVSGSMGDPSGVPGDTQSKIAGAIIGAQAFVAQLDDSATLSLIVFDDHIRTIFDTMPVGPNRDKINTQISTLTPGGATSLYDATAFAAFCLAGDPRVKQFPDVTTSPKCAAPSAEQAKRINAVVLMTDGNDTASQKYKSVTALMKDIGRSSESTGDVSIFTIGYGSDADGNVLGTVANGAGGEYQKAVSSQAITTIYRDISTFF
jgi:Ca-activated chloride channel family protein